MAYRFVGVLILALVLASELSIAESDDQWPFNVTTCARIFEYFSYCMEYLLGDVHFKVPSKRCCGHVVKLNILAKHRTGPVFICWCIQVMTKDMTPALVPSRIDALPVMCHTHLSFPISDSINCDDVS